MRKLASVLFLLLAVTANLFAQVGPTSGGGGSVSSGSAIGSCTSSLLYTDASTLLGCNPAAVVNGSVSTAGRSILTIRDTISGSSATSNFLNITGTFPSPITAETSGAYLSFGLQDNAQVQYGLQTLVSGAINGATRASATYSKISLAQGLTNNLSAGTVTSAVFGEMSAIPTTGVGVFGLASGAATNAIGVSGSATAGTNRVGVTGQATGGTSNIGGYFGLDSGTPTLTTAGALIANNGSVAANIFEARDNGTAVFTIADGGTVTVGAGANFTSSGANLNGLTNVNSSAHSSASSTGGSGYGFKDTATFRINGNTSLTPDAATLGLNATGNSFHVVEDADFTAAYDFNNGACGTSACTDPGLIIHSAVQDTTQYNHQAAWGQAGGALKTLTESSATAVVRIPVAALEGTGGKLTYRVKAADATDVQIREGEIKFAVVNKAGTETCTLSGASEAADGSVVAASIGTLTYGITCDTTPANAVDIAFNAVSSLTQTTLNIQYFVTLTGVGQPARQ